MEGTVTAEATHSDFDAVKAEAFEVNELAHDIQNNWYVVRK